MDWNPIETAPPDQWIVAISAGLFFGDGLPYRPMLTLHDSVTNYWTVLCADEEEKRVSPELFGGTHWMPLPTSSPKKERDMKDVDYDETRIIGGNMMQYGGSFVRALGAALLHADSNNICRIRQAFPEYWEQYLHIKENTGERDG